FKNVCTVSDTHGGKQQAVAVTELFDADTLYLEADGDRRSLAVGQTANVTLRAVNAGKAAEKNVRVTVTLPEGLRAIDARGAAIRGRVVAIPALPEIKAGESRSVTLRVEAVKAGEQRLAVEMLSARTGKGKGARADMAFEVRAAGK